MTATSECRPLAATCPSNRESRHLKAGSSWWSLTALHGWFVGPALVESGRLLSLSGLRGHVSAPQQARVPTDWPEWPLVWAALDIPDDARDPYEEARAGVEALVQRIAGA